VFGWGNNDDGKLGNGTTLSHRTPTLLAEGNGAFLVATPVFSGAGPGTYGSPRTIVITSATPGATVRYTTNGATPTESDPVVPGGGVLVDRSMTLSARAFLTGSPASYVTSATYAMNVDVPSATPGYGTYTSPQTVTLSTTSPGADLRYTLDGSEPTIASPLYTTPLLISTGLTLNVKGFRDGWTLSGTRSVTYTFNFGTLDAPTMTPVGGTYTSDQTVTLTAQSGAQIRYTTNGITPSSSSTLYASPLTINATTTLKARAFRPDWTASGTTTGVYTMQVATPTLSIPSGEYAPGELVTVTSATPGATIRYTLNGATPTATSPIIASGTSLTIGNYPLQAFATKTGYTTSDVATATLSLSGELTPARTAAGLNHSAVVRKDGTVWTTGRNSSGQLGDGTTTQQTAPVIAYLTGGKSLSANEVHTLAVTLEGHVYAWGSNGSGQLGDGTSSGQRTTPGIVSGLTDIVAVAAGAGHSLALTSTGQVWAWGRNTNGQIGDGGTSVRLTPYQVPGLSDVAGIAAGEAFSVAWTTTGAVWVWGANGVGQLGDGTQNERRNPTLLTNIAGVTAVAAGRQHTLAVNSAGALYAWGHNSSGQLGDNTTSFKTAPVLISSLSGVSRVAAGYSHSLAVTQSGAVYAWGGNGGYQVGDNTTTNRLAPTLLPNLPVMVDVSGGINHSIALDSSGSLWTWGTNANGQLGNGTATNQTTPAPVSDAGLSWGVSRPTLTPAPGIYTSTQQATLSTVTPGATIRYTVDGTAPTSSSTLYTTPISIDTTTTISAKAFKSGLADSATATALYTIQEMVDAPVVSPAGGTYAGPTTVTVTASPEATIYYTTDGSEPTTTSPAYTGPITIATNTTLRVRAFLAGWSPSAIVTEVYEITADTTAPVITASLSPTPNAAGWNKAPLTITFNCTDAGSGIESCSPPLTISTAGSNHQVNGTAEDYAGNVASTTVTVKLDLEAPSLTNLSPSANTVLTTSPATITGQAADGLSGLQSVTCAGGAATLDGNSFSCVVNLVDGANTIAIVATDVAGHVQTVSHVLALATPLSITPENPTLALGGSLTLRLVDGQGQQITGASWTVSDPAIVGLTAGSPTTITGLAPGEVTITASKGGRLAQTTVTIASTTVLSAGAVRWSTPGSPGSPSSSRAGMVQAQNDSGTGPDLYFAEFVEVPGQSGVTTGVHVRGMTNDGAQLWRAYVGEPEGWSMIYNAVAIADTDGSVLLWMYGGAEGTSLGGRAGIVRLDGATGVETWRHMSDLALDRPAVHPDGVLATVKHSPTQYGSRGTLLGLSVATGAVVFQHELPQGLFQSASGTACSPFRRESSPSVTDAIVGSDGKFYVGMNYHTRVDTGNCTEGSVAHTTAEDVLSLLAVEIDGTLTSRTLNEWHHDGNWLPDEPYARATSVLPTAGAGVLVRWYVHNGGSFTSVTISKINGASRQDVSPSIFGGGPYLVGEGDIGITLGVDGVTGYDLQTDQVVWTTTIPEDVALSPVTVLSGNSVLASTHDGRLFKLDPSGAVTELPNPAGITQPTLMSNGDIVGYASGGGYAATSQAPSELVESEGPFPGLEGNQAGQRAQAGPKLTVEKPTLTRNELTAIRVTGVLPAQITGWEFVSKDPNPGGQLQTISRRTQDIHTRNWPSHMVASGTVTVKFTRNNRPDELSQPITVTRRTNFSFTNIPDPEQKTHGFDPKSVHPTDPNPPLVISDPLASGASIARYISQVPSRYVFDDVDDHGANHGYRFTTSMSQPSTGIPTYFYWTVRPELTPGVTFFEQQCGNYNPATNQGFISGPALLENAKQHEAGKVGLSHYMNWKMAFAHPSANPGDAGELVVAGPAINATDYQRALDGALEAAAANHGSIAGMEPCPTANFDGSTGVCIFKGWINYPVPFGYASCTP
jgi:alpha-tubulin suppressor-like RCC1 family protein